jgi:hypothetical protein
VSRDLSKNRDLVTLGVIGKLLVFVVFFFWTAAAGKNYAAFGASIAGGLAFWDALS